LAKHEDLKREIDLGRPYVQDIISSDRHLLALPLLLRERKK